jgi:hypothetical protein
LEQVHPYSASPLSVSIIFICRKRNIFTFYVFFLLRAHLNCEKDGTEPPTFVLQRVATELLLYLRPYSVLYICPTHNTQTQSLSRLHLIHKYNMSLCICLNFEAINKYSMTRTNQLTQRGTIFLKTATVAPRKPHHRSQPQNNNMGQLIRVCSLIRHVCTSHFNNIITASYSPKCSLPSRRTNGTTSLRHRCPLIATLQACSAISTDGNSNKLAFKASQVLSLKSCYFFVAQFCQGL